MLTYHMDIIVYLALLVHIGLQEVVQIVHYALLLVLLVVIHMNQWHVL